MRQLFTEKELEALSACFILTLPEQDTKVDAETDASCDLNIKLQPWPRIHSGIHQNKTKRIRGGFYKSITRIIK